MFPFEALDAVLREVRDTTRDGAPARMVVATRTYPAPPADVWDAVTSPERLPRWFLPVSGELRLGGRYQLEGNAGGTVTTCQPPRHLGVTWEFGDTTSWVDVHLEPAGSGTTLRLEHAAPVVEPDEFWDRYGPGATGVGWDLTLLGLGEHLATGEDVKPDPADPDGLAYMRRCSEAWGRASVAYGTAPEQAEAAEARTSAFYTGG